MDLATMPRLADWLRRCHDRPAARAAVKLRAEADVATPADITRTIARMNRL
jgi:glutathione S-transferase